MRVCIPTEKPDLEAKVETRLGSSRYLMVIDIETMVFEIAPGGSGKSGGGIQAVVVAISKKVDAVLTGYCSPTAEKYLSANKIEVITGISGTIADVIEQYKEGELQKNIEVTRKPKWTEIDRVILLHELRESSKQFFTMLPMLVGVVLLIGLFNASISEEFISSIFSGNSILDTLWGACFGSIFAGNPINSYIVGGELLEYGVSLFAVTALIISWVSVGLVQLPAEISALGTRFALVRNAASFILSIVIAFTTVYILNYIKGLSL